MKKIISVLLVLIMIAYLFSVFSFTTYAAPAKPVLKNDPINGQMLPYYEVWCRWYDNSDESRYTFSLRDLGTDTVSESNPIYTNISLPANTTHYAVSTNVLERGHIYRWCISAVDAYGNSKYSDTQIFKIEDYNPDRHIMSPLTYNTNRIEYFVYATSAGYDDVLDNAAQAWNGIANVTLVRTATPIDGKYEVGIYESPNPPSQYVYGNTTSPDPEKDFLIIETTVKTYRQNIINAFNKGWTSSFIISDYASYLYANAMHEVGHALFLAHTWNDPQMQNPYDISFTIDLEEMPENDRNLVVPLIMNSGAELSYALNVVDRDHLRLKWGS